MPTGFQLIDPASGQGYRAGGAQTTGGNTIVASAPSADAGNSITPVVAGAGGTSLVVKASAGNLYSASMTAGATAGFLIAYNAAAAPAPAAALTAGLVLNVAAVAANGSAQLGGGDVPDRFSAGIVLLFSTSTTTYTVPASAALHIRGAAA